MSSYLSIYVKKKEEDTNLVEKGVPILWFSTSIARELESNIDCINYTYDNVPYYKELTVEIINKVIEYYKEEIKNLDKSYNYTKSENKRLEELAIRCDKPEVAQLLLDDIEDLAWYKEEKESLEHNITKWAVILEIAENISENDYGELVYTLD